MQKQLESNSLFENDLNHFEDNQSRSDRPLLDLNAQLSISPTQQSKVTTPPKTLQKISLGSQENVTAAQKVQKIDEPDEFKINQSPHNSSNDDNKMALQVFDQTEYQPNKQLIKIETLNQSTIDSPLQIQKEWDEKLEQYSKHISYIEKMKLKFDLNNKLIVPFDRYDYVQSIFNPLDIENEEIILVQICKPILKPNQAQIYNEQSFEPECPVCYAENDQKQENQAKAIDPAQDKKVECFYCKNPAKNGIAPICKKHEHYVCQGCCQQCLQHYVRKSVVNKTQQSEYFQKYLLKSHNQEKINSVKQDENPKILSRLEQLEYFLTPDAQDKSSNINLQNFADLITDDQDVKQKNQQIDRPEHAIVTFCKKVDGVYQSYKMIQIDRPLLIQDKKGDNRIDFQIFLHVSEDKKEIFYFTYDSESDNQIPVYNLLPLVVKTQENKEKEINKQLQTNINFKFDSTFVQTVEELNLQDLFKCIFHPNQVNINDERAFALPQLTIYNQKRFLVFHKKDTLYIFEINNEQKLIKLRLQIQNARLFLKIEEREKEIEIEELKQFVKGNEVKEEKVRKKIKVKESVVWIIRDNYFVKIIWDDNLNYQVISESTTDEVYLLTPNQKLSGRYFEKQFFELKELLDEQKSEIMQGRVHKNNTRISLLFFHGSVFTFDIKPVDQIKINKNKWFGKFNSSSQSKDKNSQIEVIDFQKRENDLNGYYDVIWNKGKNINLKTTYVDNWSGNIKFLDQEKKQIDLIANNMELGKFKIITKSQNQSKQLDSKTEYYDVNFEYEVENQDGQFQIFQFYGKFDDKVIRNSIRGKFFYDQQFKGNFSLKKSNNQKTIVLTFKHKKSGISEKQDEYRGVVQLMDDNQIMKKGFKLKNSNNNHYEFYPYYCNQIASCFNQDTAIKNCQFSEIQIKKDGSENIYESKLYQIGSVVKLWYQNDLSYQQFEVDAYDLDEEIKFNDQNNSSERKWLTFSCQLPNDFREYCNNQSKSLNMPIHILMPCLIRNLKNEFNNDYSKSILFGGQILIQNPKNQQNQLIFIEGPLVCYFKNNQENYPYQEQEYQEPKYKYQYLPQWPALLSDDIYVQFPLLAYKSQLPMRNEIVIVNLAATKPQKIIDIQPQKIIDISPFKFVKFLETGMNPLDYLDANNLNLNITIFFLVQDQQQVYRVLSYEFYPYKINKISSQISERFQETPIINILNSSISLQIDSTESLENQIKKYWIKRLSNEKIMAAAMLKQSKDKINCQNVAVVLQLVDTIVYFNLSKTQDKNRFQLNELEIQNSRMVQLKMQRANSEALYYVNRSKTNGDQIVQLTLSDYKLNQFVLKRIVGSKIIALQILQSEDKIQRENLDNHKLIYLDNQFCYTILKIEFSQQTQKPKIKVKYQITCQNANLEKNFEFFTQYHWPQIVGNKRGFSLLNDQQQMVTLGTESDTLFQDQNLFNFLGADENQQENLFVNYFAQIPQMQKCLYEIRSKGLSKFNYFVLQNSRFSRKIEIMRPDQLLAIQGGYYAQHNNALLCNSFISIQNCYDDSTMIFNQSDQKYRDTLNFWQYSNQGSQLKIYKNNSYFICVCTSLNYDYQKYQLKEDFEQGTFKFVLDNNDGQLSTQDIKTKIGNPELQTLFENQLFFDCQNEYKLYFTIFSTIGSLNKDKKNKRQDKQGELDFKFFHFEKLKVYKIASQNQKDKQYVILMNQESEKKEQQIEDFIITQDYLSFCYGNKMYSINKQILENEFSKLDPQSSKKKLNKVEENKIVKDKKQEIKEQDITTKVTDFSAIFPKYLKYTEFRLDNVQSLGKNPQKKQENNNLIQITNSEVAIIFDLHKQQEVDFIESPDQFCNFKKYVPMAILPYNKSNKQLEFGQLQQNEQGTLFLQPKKIGDDLNILFRTYCELDLLDFDYLKNNSEEQQSYNKIDLETTLAILDGKTFFEELSDQNKVVKNNDQSQEIKTLNQDSGDKQKILKQIYEQIRQYQQQNQDSEGDNILLRRLHRTLLVPVKKFQRQNEEKQHKTLLECLTSQTNGFLELE